MNYPRLAQTPRWLALALALCLSACGGGDSPAPENASAQTTNQARALGLADTATVPERWSDPATWGGTLPAAGATVLIPPGKQVLLDMATPPLKSLTIAGTLTADPARDVAITAEGVLVQGGRLSIGSADAPYLRQATITLTGSHPADLPGFAGMGAKVLAQMGGTLELHGRPLARAWTLLDGGDLAVGARRVVLAEAPGWQAGDRIVIASSSFDQAEHDVAVIEAIDGRQVTLREGLRFRHYGAVRTVGKRVVDVRAAVGLLSRNIVVQGDVNSAALKLGGHAMFMAHGAMPATVQISAVEFAAMGQLNRSGRYPLHFHEMGTRCRQCYVRDSSVRDTVQRGIVLHDTQGVTLSGNVVFNTVGHNIFVETAQTTGNVIDRNLALVNRQPSPAHTDPTLVLQNDRLPSNYWFRSGKNQVTHNVAAGSQASGFNYDGINGDAIDFRRNTAYAAMGESRVGEGDFDIFGGLLVNSESARPADERIEDVLVFHNAGGIWIEENGVTKVERFIAAGNRANLVGRGVGNRVHFKDGLVLGRLAGQTQPAGQAIAYVYGSDIRLENVAFAGFTALGISATDTNPGHSSITASGISFIGPPPAIGLADATRFDFLDDSMLPRGYYVNSFAPWMVVAAQCTQAVLDPEDAEFNTYHRCPRAYGFNELDMRSGGPNGYSAKVNPYLLRSDGLRYRRQGGDAGLGSGVHGTNVLTDAGLHYRIERSGAALAQPQALRLMDDGTEHEDPRLVPENKWVPVAIPVSAPPRAVHRTGSRWANPNAPTAANALRPASSLVDFESNPLGTYLVDSARQQVWVHASRRWVIVLP
jgi:G8 domain